MDHKQMRPGEPGAGRHTSDSLGRIKEYTRTNPQQSLPLPPYGKHVSANLIGTDQDWIFIEVGVNAWVYARTYIENGLLAMVLPEPYSFLMYRWPVTGHDVLLHWRDASDATTANFGSYLIRQGANVVLNPFTDTWVYPRKVAV